MSTAIASTVSRPTRLPLVWFISWAIVIGGAFALLYVLATDVWPKRPEMGDRFLIPLASGILLWHLQTRWRAQPRSSNILGLAAVALGAVAFPLAWILTIQVEPRTLLLWWLAGALEMASVGLLMLSHGWRRTSVVLFPMLFALFALPMPDMIQSRLLPGLKAATTWGAATVLPWLGVPAVQMGFALQLPSGILDVVDACSGALSLTSLMAIAVLTAYVRMTFLYDFDLARGIALVVLTIPIVIVSNTVRVIATGVLHEYIGVEAVQGWRHEALGYAVVLVGFGLIVGVSKKLAQKNVNLETASDANTQPALKRKCSNLTSVTAMLLLVPPAAVCLWAEKLRPAPLEVDIRSIAETLPDRHGSDLFNWTGADQKVQPEVENMLRCDQLVHRRYEDHLGLKAQVYVMYWATPANTAHIHHPDVCWPSRGCTVAESRVRPVPYAAGRAPLEVSVRHFLTPDGKRQIVFYWTQNGNSVLPDGREPSDWGSEYRWAADMLFGRQSPSRMSRLSVLVGIAAPVGRPEDLENRLAALSGQIAGELYRVCPWAAPLH